MSRASSGTITYAPVGDPLYNGMDLGGARIYPFSNSLAVAPPVQYSSYIGSGTGLPTSPPAAALTTTAGGGGAAGHIVGAPWGKSSPLPWVVGGLVVSLGAMYAIHYRK